MQYTALCSITTAVAIRGIALPLVHRTAVDASFLPNNDLDTAARAQAVEAKRETFLYAPSPDQTETVYLTGPFGNAMLLSELATLQAEVNTHQVRVDADTAAVAAAVEEV